MKHKYKLEYCPDVDTCEHHKKECYDGTYEQCKVYIRYHHPQKLSLTERITKKLGIERNLQI